jgi:hypothetical protein
MARHRTREYFDGERDYVKRHCGQENVLNNQVKHIEPDLGAVYDVMSSYEDMVSFWSSQDHGLH